MKWIKSYTNFKFDRVNENIIFTEFTHKTIIDTQFKKALESLSIDCKPEDVVNWAKKTIFSTKSDSFILRLPIEELRASGGKGGSFLKPNYYNQPNKKPDEIAYRDCEDISYYFMMEDFFSKGGGLFADPVEAFDEQKRCALLYVKQLFDNKFKSNRMPYEIIKFMMKRIRKSVATEIKLPDKNVVGFRNDSKGGPRIMGDNFHQLPHPNRPEWKESTEWDGFFKDDSPTAIIPELKKLLISCGGRGLFKPEMIKATLDSKGRISYEYLPEWKEVYEPIMKKKRTAFYNWFTKTIYDHFINSVKKIKLDTVLKHLEQIKIDLKGSKFDVGDDVVYLRKDKTIEDYKALDKEQSKDIENKPTSEIVGSGKITKISDDNFTIEYKPGKVVIKPRNMIISKV